MSFGQGWVQGQQAVAERRPSSGQNPAEAPNSLDLGTPRPFPVVEAKGTPFEIGDALGQALRHQIHTGIERRQEWFDDLKAIGLANQRERLDGFAAAIDKHYPDILDELRGLAHGAALPLDDILVLNCQVELGAMKSRATQDACSTIHLVRKDRILLLHNEDGNNAYRDLMAIGRLYPKGKPAVTALLYPGGIPGCVPGFNDAGLVMTTNFIGAQDVRIGIPRYVLGRAVISASSLDEAIAIARNPNVAYSFHMNIGSVPEQRLVAVDVSVGHSAVQETKGLFIQTNHFVLPDTKSIVQPGFHPGDSSDSRYRVLAGLIERLPPIDQVTSDDLVQLLQSHRSITKPYSPCRHPDATTDGRTLATAVFDLTARTLDLYEGNPCEKRLRRIEWF